MHPTNRTLLVAAGAVFVVVIYVTIGSWIAVDFKKAYPVILDLYLAGFLAGAGIILLQARPEPKKKDPTQITRYLIIPIWVIGSLMLLAGVALPFL